MAGCTNQWLEHSILMTYIAPFKEKGDILVASSNKTSWLFPVFSLNFSSAGKGPFLNGKAKNMCQRCTLLPNGGASHSWRLLLSSILSTNWPKNILNTSKQRILRAKAAFVARINLVTQVAIFSCWSRKSRIRTVAQQKFLACSALKGTS